MILVTSCGHDYKRPWIFPTLERLSCRVMCLLHPDDNRILQRNAEKVPYLGGRYYQHGSFLESISGIADDEVVILADADAVIQRDLSSSERAVFNGLGDEMAAGWNMRPGQNGEQEFHSIRCRCSLDGAARVLSLPATSLREAPVFNWGLVASRAGTWRRLAFLYQKAIGDWGPRLFDNLCYMQYLLCVVCHHHGIKILPLGYDLHSHAHFPPLSNEHTVRDRRLYYRQELVFFAHYVPGVTH